MTLKQAIKDHARWLGFPLAGVTTPEQPSHLPIYNGWLDSECHGSMHYLANERARTLRTDPCLILPECESILVLAAPYSDPASVEATNGSEPTGRIAAYAWNEDYHTTFPVMLKNIVMFIEEQVGYSVPNRYYTDTGPILERELAQRAGLGWIGKNTCLINPKHGSYFLLSEILLGLDLEPELPFTNDHCGTCTRCVEACPTECILPNRTIDARRCISYLTIEFKDDIPRNIRPLMGNWVFGCDICQMVCPWNRFSTKKITDSFSPRPDVPTPNLIQELGLNPDAFNRKFKGSPVKRTKRRGYLRNVAIALGNSQDSNALRVLNNAQEDPDTMVRKHAHWARDKIRFQDES